jgi:hypothetical protein
VEHRNIDRAEGEKLRNKKEIRKRKEKKRKKEQRDVQNRTVKRVVKQKQKIFFHGFQLSPFQSVRKRIIIRK